MLSHDRGVQSSVRPQTLGVPPPPQVSGAVQLPHWRRPPQPSAMGPHEPSTSSQVFGTQSLPPPHRLGSPPPPQVVGMGQPPHSMSLPQPSGAGPHSTPCSAQLRGTQGVSFPSSMKPESCRVLVSGPASGMSSMGKLSSALLPHDTMASMHASMTKRPEDRIHMGPPYLLAIRGYVPNAGDA